MNLIMLGLVRSVTKKRLAFNCAFRGQVSGIKLKRDDFKRQWPKAGTPKSAYERSNHGNVGSSHPAFPALSSAGDIRHHSGALRRETIFVARFVFARIT